MSVSQPARQINSPRCWTAITRRKRKINVADYTRIRKSQPQKNASKHTIFERLLARAFVLAVLGEDYSGEIALARAIARSAERRGN
jgi:hypothetical protein